MSTTTMIRDPRTTQEPPVPPPAGQEGQELHATLADAAPPRASEPSLSGGSPPLALPSLQRTMTFGPGAALSPSEAPAPSPEPPPPPPEQRQPRAAHAHRTVKLSLDDHLELLRQNGARSLRARASEATGRMDLPPAYAASPAPAPALARATATAGPLRRGAIIGLAAAVVAGLAAYALAWVLAPDPQAWLAPTVLSAADPRVLQVAASRQQQTARRGELLLQKKELEGRARQAKRCIELEETFQASFQAALRADLQAQRAELGRVQAALAAEDASQGGGALSANATELEAKLSAARQRVRLLEGALRGGRAAGTGTYAALALRRQYDQSTAAAEAARELAAEVDKALGELDGLLRQQDALRATLDASPYKLAAERDVVLGFVPYENADRVRAGGTLYACGAMRLSCRVAGSVGETLGGEARGGDPSSGRELRGTLVRLALSDPRDAQRPMLYTDSGLL